MSIIPVDVERTFERRWAARFLQPPAGPKAHRPDTHRQPLAGVAKSKRKIRGQRKREGDAG
jgi:hypothetical protein